MDTVDEALVRHNQRLEPEPSPATAWERPSPTIWRFTLRPGVRFQDGETFGAEDVVLSWPRPTLMRRPLRATLRGSPGGPSPCSIAAP